MNPHHSAVDRMLHRAKNKIGHIANNISEATNNFGNGPSEGDIVRSTIATVASVAVLVFQAAKPWNIAYGIAISLIGKYSNDIKFDSRLKFSHWNSPTAQRAAIALILSCCLPVPFNQVGVSYVMGWAMANIWEYIDHRLSRGDAPAT